MMTIIPTARKHNRILLLLFFLSTVAYAQNKFPKETIYILFKQDSINKKYFNYKSPRINPKKGVFFAIGKYPNGMGLFYDNTKDSDTLNIQALKKFKFEKNRKEIDRKERVWYHQHTQNMQPIDNKNWVFNTYLIEVISDNRIVVYPVEWVGEGVIH